MEKFGDPEFVTHATAARLYTLIAMRAAAAEVVPLKFVPYGEALREYVDDLRRMVARKARAVEPGRPSPPIEFDGLPEPGRGRQGVPGPGRGPRPRRPTPWPKRDGVAPAQLAKVNDALTRVERSFLLPKGLPGRPWFKHAVYAPGLTTGYASWTLPGFRQAIIENDAEMLAAQLPALVERIDAATEAMKAARGRPAIRSRPITDKALAHVPRLVKSCRVRCADRPNAVRNTLISRIFRQGPHSGPYKSGVQPPLWAHEPRLFLGCGDLCPRNKP